MKICLKNCGNWIWLSIKHKISKQDETYLFMYLQKWQRVRFHLIIVFTNAVLCSINPHQWKIYLWSLALSLCQEETLKAAAYVCWCVQSLVTLEQGGSINLNSLEAQLETLLESIVTFSPPGETSSPSVTLSPNRINIASFIHSSSAETGLEQRHMAFCGLFSDALALLNGVGVSTGEALAAHVITWLDRKGRGFPILPLLTACTQCLASVRHMTRIMEACITAYFNHCEQSNILGFLF